MNERANGLRLNHMNPNDTAPRFPERTPENLEKYIDLVEDLQNSVPDESYFESHAENVVFQDAAASTSVSKDARSRTRTHLRIKYEAEVDVIKRQIGDLEELRSKLGLSRRKMCQMLLVDPSSWTRWTKEGAPPHVYRALEWYFLLQKEAPHHAHSYWLATVGAQLRTPSFENQIHKIRIEASETEEELKKTKAEIESLKATSQKLKIRFFLLTGVCLFLSLLILFLILN